MAGDNWRELLDDPEVRRIIQQVARVEGRKVYPSSADALLLDDVESHLWDASVLAAQRSSHQPGEDSFYAYLYACMRVSTRQHRAEIQGDRGTTRRQAMGTTASLDALYAQNAESGAYAGALVNVEKAGPNYLFTRRLSPNDPLGHLLYLERLAGALEAAKKRAPAYTVESSPGCSEPMCTMPVLRGGLCNGHYQRDRAMWGRGGPTCSAEDCQRLATARGWCDKHYRRNRRARRRGEL